MWVTQHSIVDWVHFKTQLLLATLRTQNQPRVESCVSSEAEHLSPSVGCARHKDQFRTILQNLKSFRWMLDCELDGLLALDLCDVIIQVLRSTNNIARQGRLAQGDLGGTRDHSINKTKTKTPTEKSKRDVAHLSNVETDCENVFRDLKHWRTISYLQKCVKMRQSGKESLLECAEKPFLA